MVHVFQNNTCRTRCLKHNTANQQSLVASLKDVSPRFKSYQWLTSLAPEYIWSKRYGISSSAVNPMPLCTTTRVYCACSNTLSNGHWFCTASTARVYSHLCWAISVHLPSKDRKTLQGYETRECNRWLRRRFVSLLSTRRFSAMR